MPEITKVTDYDVFPAMLGRFFPADKRWVKNGLPISSWRRRLLKEQSVVRLGKKTCLKIFLLLFEQ